MQGLLEVPEGLPKPGNRKDRFFLSQAFTPGAAGKLPGVLVLRQSLPGTGHHPPWVFNNPVIKFQCAGYSTGRFFNEKS
jgi:hypothetical protein